MPIDQVIFLSIIQGLTEFWPISSSAHLNLVHILTDFQDQGILMDISVHLGTLLAVILFYRKDVVSLFLATPQVLSFKYDNKTKALINLIIATIPIVIIGFLAAKFDIIDMVRSIEVIAITNLIFAIILYFSNKYKKDEKSYDNITIKDSLLIGLFQIFAIIPGASRSGVTMSMGCFLGLKHEDSAKFSMLLSIPTILAASLLLVTEIIKLQDIEFTYLAFVAISLSFIIAYFSIAILLKILKKLGFMPFIIYRILLSLFLFGVIYYI